MKKVIFFSCMMCFLFKLVNTQNKFKQLSRKDVSLKKGIAIYQIDLEKKNIEIDNESGCMHCFSVKREDLKSKPLISENEIEEFDFKKQKIKLTDSGKIIINNLEIPLRGMPVVMTLNDEIIYGFWFWNLFSSFGCDQVYAYPKLDFKLEFGLPINNFYENDPRYNHKLKKYL